jgi:hypothetical protein
MSPILPDAERLGHLAKLEAVRPEMTKALNKIEVPWRARVGRAIARTFALAGLSHKEAAALLDRDQAQISRWVSGEERPAIDLIFSVPRLRAPLVIGLAELASDGVEITTAITIKRTA